MKPSELTNRQIIDMDIDVYPKFYRKGRNEIICIMALVPEDKRQVVADKADEYFLKREYEKAGKYLNNVRKYYAEQ